MDVKPGTEPDTESPETGRLIAEVAAGDAKGIDAAVRVVACATTPSAFTNRPSRSAFGQAARAG